MGPELGTVGSKCCKVRQVRASEARQGTDGSDWQVNTSTQPGYSKIELLIDPTQVHLDSSGIGKPTCRERTGLAKSVVYLCRQWYLN